MPADSSIVYLHGFASGPGSRKARFFAERLGALGIDLLIPDLAEGDFEHLTISRQLTLISRVVGDKPVKLIGSSLGGYLAALYAARHQNVTKVVLLAPAFGLHELWKAQLGPERLAEWERSGTMPVFHYGEGRDCLLSYEFFRDAGRYEPFPDMRQPALLIHGEHDAAVPLEQSLAFVREHSNARLMSVESGHELTDVLENIWLEIRPFLLEGH